MKSFSKNIDSINSNISSLQQENNKNFSPKNNKPFFIASFVQTKLSVNQPNDVYEQEANAMADKVIQNIHRYSFADASDNSKPFFSKPVSNIHRKCAACEEKKLQKKDDEDSQNFLLEKFKSQIGSLKEGEKIQRKCAECEEEEKKLQKKSKANSFQTISSFVSNNLNDSKSSGRPLPQNTRNIMGSSFGEDFSHVQIHDDSVAAKMSKDLHAQAFTHGSDIYFNTGKFDTNSFSGKHLLAHELTHVLQQQGGSRIQKQDDEFGMNETTTEDTASQIIESANQTEEPEQTVSTTDNQQSHFIVEDFEEPDAGQMCKSDFLSQLNAEVCATVDEALAGTSHSSNNCPYIRAAFARYQGSSPSQIEEVIQRYAPATRGVQNAYDVIQTVKIRVEAAVNQWKENGSLAGVPGDIAAQIPGSSSEQSGNLLFKTESGNTQTTQQSPLGVMHSLGKGKALDTTTRSKMEFVFETNFSNVEIHTDSKAGNLSDSMNARAFTVGNHIAFKNGEHKPGTLIGDALLAHELAHVMQQQKGSVDAKSNDNTNYARLEEEADVSAVNTVMRLRGMKGGLKEIRKQLMPRLKSGLQLQRCQAAPALAVVFALSGEGAAGVGAGAVATTAIVETGTTVAVVEGSVLVGGTAAPTVLSTGATIAVTEGVTLAPTVAATPALVSAPAVAVVSAPSVGAVVTGTAIAATTLSSDSPKTTEEESKPSCQVYPLGYHRGGNPRHDNCADVVPPNYYPGSDIEVSHTSLGRKSFDAVDPVNHLWEVKTEDYSSYPPFLKDVTIQSALLDIAQELPLSIACGYGYTFGVTDPQFYSDLLAQIPPGVNLQLINC